MNIFLLLSLTLTKDYLFTILHNFFLPPQLLLLFHIWLSGGILRFGTVLSSLVVIGKVFIIGKVLIIGTLPSSFVVIGKVIVLGHSHWSQLITGQRRELPDDQPDQLAGGEDLLDQAAAHRQVPPPLLSHRLLPHRLWGGQRSQLCQRLLRSLPPNILSDSHMVHHS